MLSPLPSALLALFLLTFAATAHAQSAPAGFQSPSKNITYQYFEYDKEKSLRCDINATETNRDAPPIATPITAAPSR